MNMKLWVLILYAVFIDSQLHINWMLRHKHSTFEQKYNQYLQLLY